MQKRGLPCVQVSPLRGRMPPLFPGKSDPRASSGVRPATKDLPPPDGTCRRTGGRRDAGLSLRSDRLRGGRSEKGSGMPGEERPSARTIRPPPPPPARTTRKADDTKPRSASAATTRPPFGEGFLMRGTDERCHASARRPWAFSAPLPGARGKKAASLQGRDIAELFKVIEECVAQLVSYLVGVVAVFLR